MKEKFVVTIFFQFITNTFYIISSYFLAVNLDVELMGMWVLIGSIVNIGFVLADLGIDSIHLQYSGKSNFIDYFGTYFVIRIIVISMNIAISLTLILIFQLWNTVYIKYLLILLVSRILFNINSIFLNNLRTKFKIFKVEIPNFIFFTFKSFAILYLAFNLSYISNPLLVLTFINIFSESLFICLTLFISKRDLKFSKFRKDFALSYLRDTKPLIIGSIFIILAGNIGNILLDIYFGHKSLAYYSLVYNYIIGPLLLISLSIQTLFLAVYSQLFEKKDIDSIIIITHKVENFSSILFLSIIIIILLNGELILLIFLPNYLKSYPILIIMIFIPYLNGIFSPYAMHLIPGKKQKLNAILWFIIYSSNLILIILLIPQFGAIGLSIAMLLSSIISAIIWHSISYKIFKIPSQIRILFHIILAVFAFILSFLLKVYLIEKLIPNNMILLFISTIFVLIVFLSQIIVLKQLKKEDLHLIFELLKIGNYKKSIMEEFSK